MTITPSIDGERLIAVFAALVEPLGHTMPANCEVTLHDLSKLPNSIVAISGTVTGRSIGDPATDLLLEQAASGRFENRLGYETCLPDGRRLRSSTMIIKDVSGNPVAALCVNADMTVWEQIQHIAGGMLGASAAGTIEPAVRAVSEKSSPEMFVHDVDELAAHLIRQAITATGIPVDLMQKRHKVEVVRDLKSRGLFMLKDAVELIAGELDVTRFTIYNYLNQIGDEDEPSAATSHS
ncbi:Predicted transcriptional regulator YheO, contains PAS and DNA-binding HTH domains [Paramicrobacterium humi]|uniref:Predicted transcriptional regulator YheO, contains PAS and DNA-binding HTH domains n=1 Tax=Paramicrobacterium humi TaxID=640635 RepID=A0A1H4IW00_9MICO|nr:PAS domain-containing protein [Microbacterium humi]SEB38270.1 Predicted transcriptional regulator YheO, contains PAS and DNA-binding HTH domains [Microbacterium humi]